MFIARLVLICSLVSGSPALTHEFWIEPEKYQVESGTQVVAQLRNGQEFEGIALAWFDNRFTRFDMTLGDETRNVDGRLGDTPALDALAWQDGLLIVVHETTPSSLTYTEWEKFLKFADHKDFATAAADHKAAGWSMERFRESYTRHAKALLAVGAGAGQDRAFGLATEFIALTNPYADDFDGMMKVRVEYQGEPRADAQVEVFEKTPSDDVTITLHRTDENGVASIPVASGNSYLFDAVVLRPSDAAGSSDTAPVWDTLWAALTFMVP